MCFRHVPEQFKNKLDDQSQTMVLIGFHSSSAYMLYSPNDDKLVISRDVLVDERKGWDWSQGSIRHELDTITIVLEEDQQTNVQTNRNEKTLEQNVRRSTRARTESTRLAGYERFPDQAVNTNGDLIEKSMMMTEAKSISLYQAMNDLNWLAFMK